MCFAATSFPLSLFSFLLTLCILQEGRCTDEWIKGFSGTQPFTPSSCALLVCKGGLCLSTVVNLWERGVSRERGNVAKGKIWHGAEGTLHVWAKCGADTWGAGFRPGIAAHSMPKCSQALLRGSCPGKCRSAVCPVACMAPHDAARSREALCSCAKSECPMLVLTPLL